MRHAHFHFVPVPGDGCGNAASVRDNYVGILEVGLIVVKIEAYGFFHRNAVLQHLFTGDVTLRAELPHFIHGGLPDGHLAAWQRLPGQPW